MKAVVARRALWIPWIAVIVSAAACEAPPQAPDYLVVPLLEIDRRWAGPGDPVELTYRFEIGPDNGVIGSDYEVLVDFVDGDGKTIFSHHHMPPTPTSAWLSGSVVQYRRTVFVPHNADPGPTTVELRLRVPEEGQLIALSDGEGGGSIVSEVGRLTVDAQSTGVPVSHKGGWYGVEIDAADPATQWQWTAGLALSTFPNPHTDAVVYLHALANVDADGTPPEVSVRVGPGLLEVARFRVEQSQPFLERIYVPATLMGGMQDVELVIRTDQVMVPSGGGASGDSRPLGLRVFNLHLAPKPNWTNYQLELVNPIALVRPDDPYLGEFVFTDEWDWFSGNIPVWEEVLAPFKGRPDIHYLEVGVFEGRSYTWMTENIFTHPTSTLTAVDLFTGFEDVSGETVKATFLENVRRSGAAPRSTLYTGYSQLEMRKLPLDSYDVIYIDGAHDAANVLEDVMLARRLLKDDGIIIFDDYDWPTNPGVKLAVNTFVQIYGEEFSIVHRGYQLILRKGERS